MTRWTRSRGRPRPRGVWIALGTGLLGSLAIVVTVFVPLLGLMLNSAGAGWVVPIPLGPIALASVAGFGLAGALLSLIGVVRTAPLAWVIAVAAIGCTLLTSLFPVVAVARAGVERGGEVLPRILEWFGGTGLLG